MPKATGAWTAFNAGELSPSLAGRTDFNKYPSGLEVCENWIPTVQGPLRRRAGTRFVAEVKNSADRAWLCRFEFSVDQAYQLEFGPGYIRFYTWDTATLQRGRLESPPGTPVEVATPYTASDLFAADGTCRLRVAQSGDVLYICCPGFQPRLLTRTSPTAFSLSLYEAKGGPWKDLNLTATTVYASAETGSVTLTASAAVFQAGHVGSLFYLESKDVNAIPAWEPAKSITAGARRRSNGLTYEALNSATTGSVKPVHTEGAQIDGDTGVQWEFRDPGYGWVQITGFTSATQVSATVLSRLPSQCVGVGNPTTRWAHGAWSNVEGWPTDVAFFRERLWFARRTRVWGSVASDFSDFSPRDNGVLSDDMAISLTIASGQINDAQWLLPDKDLLIGTAGGEFSLGELSNGSPIAPGNVRVRLQSRFGSRAIIPVQAGSTVLFVQRAGLKVREIGYDFASDGYQSNDTTTLSEHITLPGLVDIDYAQEPDSIVWCARSDGALIGFTWNAEQNVRAWHRHPLDGVVESVSTMPAAEGDRNELWLIVRRTVNGIERRYVEYMERPYRTGDNLNFMFYVDCGLTYLGAATTTISGLSHLEGKTVAVLANGMPHPSRVVTGGQITLDRLASAVQVGLPIRSRARTVRPEVGAADGTAQGKTKRAHKIVVRMRETGALSVGRTVDALDEVEFRTSLNPMDAPVPLFTGDRVVPWPAGYDMDGNVEVVVDRPVPAEVVAIYQQIVTEDAR